MKIAKLTIEAHRRLKMHCAKNDRKMLDVLSVIVIHSIDDNGDAHACAKSLDNRDTKIERSERLSKDDENQVRSVQQD